MEYRLSKEYVRMRENGPRRATLMMLIVMAILGFGTYLGGSEAGHDPVGLAIPFGITALVLAAILFFQIRSMRRELIHLRKVRFVLADEGLSVTSQSHVQLLRYSAIKSVDIVRGYFRGHIKMIVLHTELGKVALPHLDRLEQFVAALKERLPTMQFREKRSWFA